MDNSLNGQWLACCKRLISHRVLLAAMAFLAICPVTGFAETETEVKAAFLERFTRFIDWPESSAVNNQQTAFQLCMVRDRNFAALLQQLYASKTIKEKPVQISVVDDLQNLSLCDLLYIPVAARALVSEILATTASKPILTVGEEPALAEQGVIISLYFENSKPKFSVNERALKESGLKMSYMLLRLATIVERQSKPMPEEP